MIKDLVIYGGKFVASLNEEPFKMSQLPAFFFGTISALIIGAYCIIGMIVIFPLLILVALCDTEDPKRFK